MDAEMQAESVIFFETNASSSTLHSALSALRLEQLEISSLAAHPLQRHIVK
jgi:hypothetical protein